MNKNPHYLVKINSCNQYFRKGKNNEHKMLIQYTQYDHQMLMPPSELLDLVVKKCRNRRQNLFLQHR